MNSTLYAFLEKEKRRIIAELISTPSIKIRATIKITRKVLLNAPLLIDGVLREVKAKSLGAGVYELSIEK